MTQRRHSRIAQVRLAVMLLTRLPAGHLPDPAPTMGQSAWAWPLVGTGLGAIGAGIWGVLSVLGVASAPAILVAMGAMALASGAMHEDGLADVADGFGGGASLDRKLEIMRDSRIGSYGVLAVVLVVACQVSALAALPPGWTLVWALIGAAAISRAMMTLVLALLPPARRDGLGESASQVGLSASIVAVILGLFALMPLGFAALFWTALAAVATTAVLMRLAFYQIRGQTGDVCGAAQKFSETAVLLTLTAVL